jgi:hypothetical protein
MDLLSAILLLCLLASLVLLVDARLRIIALKNGVQVHESDLRRLQRKNAELRAALDVAHARAAFGPVEPALRAADEVLGPEGKTAMRSCIQRGAA